MQMEREINQRHVTVIALQAKPVLEAGRKFGGRFLCSCSQFTQRWNEKNSLPGSYRHLGKSNSSFLAEMSLKFKVISLC